MCFKNCFAIRFGRHENQLHRNEQRDCWDLPLEFKYMNAMILFFALNLNGHFAIYLRHKLILFFRLSDIHVAVLNLFDLTNFLSKADIENSRGLTGYFMKS